jgi:hypothetical protein
VRCSLRAAVCPASVSVPSWQCCSARGPG